MKILLIAGHGAGDPGACSSYGIEADETRNVVSRMYDEFKNYNVSVDVYPTNRNAYSDVCNGSVQLSFGNYDYVFEVHFNSASGNAYGTEIWVTPDESGTSVEQEIVNKVAACGLTNRGVKSEYFAVITRAKNAGASSALMEVCFVSNKSDMDTYRNKFTQICRAMVDAIASGFEIDKASGYKEGTSDSTPAPSPTPAQSVAKEVAYRVKTVTGKQLGAFNILENAKSMAMRNNAIVYDVNGNVVISYADTSSNKYLNLHPHMDSWYVYPTNIEPVIGNQCGALAPSEFDGLSYWIVANPETDVYTIDTQSFGRVNIYAPRDNDSSITESPVY